MNAAQIPVDHGSRVGIPFRVGTQYISVGMNALQHWIVSDNLGRLHGIFRSRKPAMQFALDEAETRHCCVVVDCCSLGHEYPRRP
jgi:hypothetical protein